MVLTVRGMKDIIRDLVRTAATPVPSRPVSALVSERAETSEEEGYFQDLSGLERAAAHPSPKRECTLCSPSLSSLTLCPLLTDKTNHHSAIGVPSSTSEAFPLNAGMMFCMENSLVKCIAELRSLTALGETLA